MKRMLSILIVIMLCLSVFAGCKNTQYKEPVSCVSYIGIDGTTTLIDLTEDAQAEIISALNSGEWVNDLTNCGHDYEFTIDNATVRYHSECGSFNDITNKRAMTLSEEGKANINKILGIKVDGNEGNNGSTNDDDLTHSGYQAAIKFMQYNWDGWGVSTKFVATCDLAYSIIDAVEEMTETGETIEKISDDVVDVNSTELPIDRGTLWLDVGSKIYRIDPDLTQLCRVEGHLGKGYVLNMSEEFKTMLRDAWYYYPYDFYSGTYKNSTDEIALNHVYDADSTVQVYIKDIKVENKYDPINTITVELLSTTDQTVSVQLDCKQSNDNLAAGDFKEITLTKGTPETVELSFGGWKDFSYWIYLEVDNTRVQLTIEP